MDVKMIDLNSISTITTMPCVLTLGFFDGVHRGHQHRAPTCAKTPLTSGSHDHGSPRQYTLFSQRLSLFNHLGAKG